jgi:hypothetical protein
MTCVECGSDYLWNKARARAGGLRTHCLDCCDETAVKYVGVAAGEGKMSAVQVLKFNSTEDRERYVEAWKVNSGLYKGKSCQIGRGLTSTPSVKFQTVTTNNPNQNAKGRAE